MIGACFVVPLLEVREGLLLLQELSCLLNQVGRHFTLIFTGHDGRTIVAKGLKVTELDRFVYLLWLKPVRFFKIFSITVVKLVAVNSVRVFESLAIDIDVLFNVSSKTNDTAGIKPRIPVNE